MTIDTSSFTLQDFTEAVKRWREDVREDCKYPADAYPDFSSTPLYVFDPVCDVLNSQWREQGSGFRIGYSMGEFIAGYVRQLELL